MLPMCFPPLRSGRSLRVATKKSNSIEFDFFDSNRHNSTPQIGQPFCRGWLLQRVMPYQQISRVGTVKQNRTNQNPECNKKICPATMYATPDTNCNSNGTQRRPIPTMIPQRNDLEMPPIPVMRESVQSHIAATNASKVSISRGAHRKICRETGKYVEYLQAVHMAQMRVSTLKMAVVYVHHLNVLLTGSVLGGAMRTATNARIRLASKSHTPICL